jgi:hypothetical protein
MLKKILLDVFNAVIGVFAFLLIVGFVIFMAAWSSGFIEKKMPSLNCWLSGPKTEYRSSGDTLYYMIYKKNCDCDTVIYTKNSHDTIRVPSKLDSTGNK